MNRHEISMTARYGATVYYGNGDSGMIVDHPIMGPDDEYPQQMLVPIIPDGHQTIVLIDADTIRIIMSSLAEDGDGPA